VQAIVNELKGEKIDIVNYSLDNREFVANALSPAKVIGVYPKDDEKVALVIVPDYQLSLAIGKEGQNARLAAKLTGWKIDIKSESQALAQHLISREDEYYSEEEYSGYDENREYEYDEGYTEDEYAADEYEDNEYSDEYDEEYEDEEYEEYDEEGAYDEYEESEEFGENEEYAADSEYEKDEEYEGHDQNLAVLAGGAGKDQDS
jgi:N utilization substance protein A